MNRRYVVLSALTAAGIVGLALLMRIPAEDRLGTPEYFERLTGIRIRIQEPVVFCRRESTQRFLTYSPSPLPAFANR